jgi:chaperonin cofactor prefoldin
MEAMRKSWTDERLDFFVEHTDQRFDALERRMDGLEHRMERLEHRMEEGFNRINDRLDSLQRIMLQTNAVIIAALIGIIATQL